MSVAPSLMLLDEPIARHPSECPVEAWLAFLGHRWNALLLWHLQSGAKRHGELLSRLPGVTSKVLAERLGSMEERGLIERSARATFPRVVTYELSARGARLVPILDQLEIWSRIEDG